MSLDLRMARVRDLNPLMRTILLLALTGFLLKLLLRGELPQFIHPKFTWFTASAGLGLLLMAIGQFRRFLRGTTGMIHPFRYRLYTALATVICVGFLLQPHTFGADLAAKQGLNVTNRSSATPPAAAVTTVAPAVSPAGPTTPEPPVPTQPADVPATSGATPPETPTLPPVSTDQGDKPEAEPVEVAPEPPGEPVTITPQNFIEMMYELYDYPEKYQGRRLTMDGFVFYPPDVQESEFAIVRLVVTCHVAHAYPDGLVTYLPDQGRPAQDGWYQVEGVLEPWTYQGKPTLKLRVEHATPIEQPTEPYVYP